MLFWYICLNMYICDVCVFVCDICSIGSERDALWECLILGHFYLADLAYVMPIYKRYVCVCVFESIHRVLIAHMFAASIKTLAALRGNFCSVLSWVPSFCFIWEIIVIQHNSIYGLYLRAKRGAKRGADYLSIVFMHTHPSLLYANHIPTTTITHITYAVGIHSI